MKLTIVTKELIFALIHPLDAMQTTNSAGQTRINDLTAASFENMPPVIAPFLARSGDDTRSRL